MIIREYKAPNPQWDIYELVCEKTGISIQKLIMNTEPHYTVYKIKDSSNSYDITEGVFEILKKLIV